MHQAYRHQGRWIVQKSVGGMGGPKNIEDLLKEKGVCFWDSQNMGRGMDPLAPLAPLVPTALTYDFRNLR